MVLKIVTEQHFGKQYQAVVGKHNSYYFPDKPSTLGFGVAAFVQLCEKRGQAYAAKVMTMSHLGNKAIKMYETEANVANDLVGHPNILKLVESFITENETDNNLIFVLVFEYMMGRNLIFYMFDGPYHESINRYIFRQLLDGINYMHSKGYVHLDIKPENLLMSNKKIPNPVLKIGDFGTVQKVNDGYATAKIGFSVAYCSPELLFKRKCKKSHDIWSAACTLYYMLEHVRPFCRQYLTHEAKKNIKTGTYNELKQVSNACKDLMRRMLQVNPEKRITAEEALNHEWFKLDESELREPHDSLNNCVLLLHGQMDPEVQTNITLILSEEVEKSPKILPNSANNKKVANESTTTGPIAFKDFKIESSATTSKNKSSPAEVVVSKKIKPKVSFNMNQAKASNSQLPSLENRDVFDSNSQDPIQIEGSSKRDAEDIKIEMHFKLKRIKLFEQ